ELAARAPARDRRRPRDRARAGLRGRGAARARGRAAPGRAAGRAPGARVVRAEAEARTSERETADLWRLLSFARPYVWPIALAVAFALVCAGGLPGRASLTKIVFDDVLVPTAAIKADALGRRVTAAPSAASEPAQDQAEVRKIEHHVREKIWRLV